MANIYIVALPKSENTSFEKENLHLIGLENTIPKPIYLYIYEI